MLSIYGDIIKSMKAEVCMNNQKNDRTAEFTAAIQYPVMNGVLSLRGYDRNLPQAS